LMVYTGTCVISMAHQGILRWSTRSEIPLH
ncbi:uncharacterized protein METZ01_LOCUS247983, partial [marine metagenome]